MHAHAVDPVNRDGFGGMNRGPQIPEQKVQSGGMHGKRKICGETSKEEQREGGGQE